MGQITVQALEQALSKEIIANKELRNIIIEMEEEIRLLQKQLSTRNRCKSRFSYSEQLEIRKKRMQGISINRLADEYKCSTSVIRRIVKDIKIDLRKSEYMKGTYKCFR